MVSINQQVNIKNFLPDVHSATILICDDQEETRALIKHSLENLSCEIIEAVDAFAAQKICIERLPDVIIMDILMPGMTGIEFVKWLRDFKPEQHVPIMLLTALDDMEHRVEGFQTGADDYLTKPFSYKELQVRVLSLLRIKILTEKLIKAQNELVAIQLAGATAHNLGQPVTSILMNCHLLEKNLQPTDNPATLRSIQSIKAECESMKKILEKLKIINPENTTEYLGHKILDLG